MNMQLFLVICITFLMQMFPNQSHAEYACFRALNVGQTGSSSGQAAMPNCAEGNWIQFGRVNSALSWVFSLLQYTWMNPRLLTLLLSLGHCYW